MPEYQETVEKYGDPFDMMARGMRVMDFVLLPIVALLTGAFVGIVALSAVWQTAAISLIPLALLVLAGHSWDLKGFVLSGVYLVLCGAASLLVHKLKGQKTRCPDGARLTKAAADRNVPHIDNLPAWALVSRPLPHGVRCFM